MTMKSSEELTEDRVDELLGIIDAFCEYSNKCPKCYRNINEKDVTMCSDCGKYCGDCDCEPLTKSQIINGY